MSDIDLNKKIRGLLTSALQNHTFKNYNDAINNLKAAYVLDKDNPQILYNLGISYCKLGLFKTASEYFEKIMKLQSTFVDIAIVKKLSAYASINSNDLHRAEDLLLNVLTHMPRDLHSQQMLAFIYDKKEKYSDAIKLYESIIAFDPACYNAYNALAYIIAKTGHGKDKSLKYAAKALKSNHTNPAYNDTMGYVLMKIGEFQKAEKFLIKAQKLRPLNDEIKEHLIELDRMKKK